MNKQAQNSSFSDAPHSVATAEPVEVASQPYVAYVMTLLVLVNITNYMDRMALSVLLPLIKQDMQLSDGQLGLLVGLAFSLFYALCCLPLARLADRRSRRTIIAGCLAVWSLATALSGAAQNFYQLFIARFGVGAGEAGCLPPSQSLICDYVRPEKRSGMFAVHNMGLFLGTTLGMFLAGWLGQSIGWRWTFVALGLPGLALALLVRLTLRDPPRGNFDPPGTHGAENVSLRDVIATLWQIRSYRWLIIFYVATGYVQFGLYQWLPSFYERSHQLKTAEIGTILGLVLGIGSSVGVLAGGFAADRFARLNPQMPLKIGGFILACCPFLAIAALFAPTSSLSFGLIAAMVLLSSIPSAPAVTAIYGITPARMRATAGALSIFLSSVLGFGLGPLSVGVLSDMMTPAFGADALRYALLLPVAILFVLAIALFRTSQTLRQDLSAVRFAGKRGGSVNEVVQPA